MQIRCAVKTAVYLRHLTPCCMKICMQICMRFKCADWTSFVFFCLEKPRSICAAQWPCCMQLCMHFRCADSMCRFDVQIRRPFLCPFLCPFSFYTAYMGGKICTSNLHIQSASSVLGLVFYCISNLHSNAADVLLHIQSAHRKRKCNRPLNTDSSSMEKEFANYR
jgi:hypothetical protein